MSDPSDRPAVSKRSIGQFFAATGVILSLVFVGFEVRQNSLMMRAQTRNEIARTVIESLDSEREPGLADAFRRWLDGADPLPEDEFYFNSYARALLRMWENMFYQYQNGLFDEAEFDAEMVAWVRMTQYDWVIDFWNTYREEYSVGFRDIIDGLIADGQRAAP